MPNSEFMPVSEAAVALGMSRWTLARALADPDNPLTGMRLGSGDKAAWMMRRSDVERLRAERAAQLKAEADALAVPLDQVEAKAAAS